jgi:hypothetical protein
MSWDIEVALMARSGGRSEWDRQQASFRREMERQAPAPGTSAKKGSRAQRKLAAREPSCKTSPGGPQMIIPTGSLPLLVSGGRQLG